MAGVSWTWAVMTAVNNAAWVGYFVWSSYWTSIVPAAVVSLATVVLAVALARRGRPGTRRSALAVVGWVAVMAGSSLVFGRTGLGGVLAVAAFVQVAPSVWTAWRSADVSGISVATWWLVMGELACFGLFGLLQGDPRVTALGVVGVTASTLMLLRVAVAGRASLRITTRPRITTRLRFGTRVGVTTPVQPGVVGLLP